MLQILINKRPKLIIENLKRVNRVSELENDLRQLLLQGTADMSVTLAETQVEKLLIYIGEFEKWNKAYNLSAIRDIREMVKRHLLDSLSVVPYFQQTKHCTDRILDVGTGGGLPGIPLAIMFPKKQFILLDSNGKKTRFLFHIKTLLQLNNVTIENNRAENFHPVQNCNVIISRAFSSLQDMIENCGHLLVENGVFMAMKGLFPADEIKTIANKITVLETIKLNVAETDGERHLLILQTSLVNLQIKNT
jgi:16S rRNA (guanine527-N7)-methyltransferase